MLADVDPLAEMAALNYSGWVDPLPPHVQDPREAFGPLRDPRYGSPPADPNAPPPGSKANPLPAGLGPGPGGSFTDNIAEEMMNYGHPDGGLEIKAIDDEVRCPAASPALRHDAWPCLARCVSVTLRHGAGAPPAAPRRG